MLSGPIPVAKVAEDEVIQVPSTSSWEQIHELLRPKLTHIDYHAVMFPANKGNIYREEGQQLFAEFEEFRGRFDAFTQRLHNDLADQLKPTIIELTQKCRKLEKDIPVATVEVGRARNYSQEAHRELSRKSLALDKAIKEPMDSEFPLDSEIEAKDKKIQEKQQEYNDAVNRRISLIKVQYDVEVFG